MSVYVSGRGRLQLGVREASVERFCHRGFALDPTVGTAHSYIARRMASAVLCPLWPFPISAVCALLVVTLCAFAVHHGVMTGAFLYNFTYFVQRGRQCTWWQAPDRARLIQDCETSCHAVYLYPVKLFRETWLVVYFKAMLSLFLSLSLGQLQTVVHRESLQYALRYAVTAVSMIPIVLAALAGQAMAKTFQGALTGYYNGIDTIGDSGTTAHFK